MNTRPSVTLAVPVFNGDRYLASLLQTVREQDVDDLEIIIADNASTDLTLDIAMAAAGSDERVRVLRADSNLGAAWNFNRSYAAATGTYFKWVAADDLIEPTFVSECRAALESDAGVVLAYPRVVDIGPQDEVLRHWGPMVLAHQSGPAERFQQVLVDPKRGFPIFGLMRRVDLGRTCLIGSYTGSDLTLLSELALMGRFHEVAAELFFHREHDQRSTRTYEDYRERTRWFDTTKNPKWSHPYWAQYRGYTRAMMRSRMPPFAYVLSVGHLAGWGKKHFRYLGHEVKVSTNQLLGRGPC